MISRPAILRIQLSTRIKTTAQVGFLLLLAGAAACSKAAPTSLPATQIIAQATARMKSLPGFHFLIVPGGGPAYLNADQNLAFGRAEGDFVAPNRAKASVRVIAPGMVVQVQVTGIGERYWETNLLSGEWQELPAGEGFNPAVLFDPQVGLQPILLTDLTDLRLVGIEELKELPGKRLYTLSGKMEGEHIFQLSYGLIGPGEIDLKLWIDPQTFDLARAELAEPVQAGQAPATTWQMDFWDFGKPADIQPPPVNSK